MASRTTIAALLLVALAVTLVTSCGSSDPADGAGGGTPVTSSGSSTYVPPDDTEVECIEDAHCAVDDPCTIGKCVEHRCTAAAIPDGPVPGVLDDPTDCLDVRCVAGRLDGFVDDSEAASDDDDCTLETCSLDGPVIGNAPAGTRCPAGECNDRAQCTGCVEPADCGGSDSFCRTRTCVASICGYALAEAGMPLPEGDQTPGDCELSVCDGEGKVAIEPDDTDVPEADRDDPCTEAACGEGGGRRSVDPGTDCGGGNVCNGKGDCVECHDDSQCTPPDVCGGMEKDECGCDADTKLMTCFQRCGTVTGNCGQVEECGGCKQRGKVCFENDCCTPEAPTEVCEGVQCGSVIDNCGQPITCDDSCVAPETCGGGSAPNVCGCTEDGQECAGKNCGPTVTNCGRAVTCAPDACAAPQTCGGGGAPNVCGCTDDGTDWCAGLECGTVPNNCGDPVTCPPSSCSAPLTCGGGGVPNTCGCTDDGSACEGKQCGTATNNCGLTVTCAPNQCPGGTLCGVPTPNQCGTE